MQNISVSTNIYIWNFDFWSKSVVTCLRNSFIEPKGIIVDADDLNVTEAWGLPVLNRCNARDIAKESYLLIDRHSYARYKRIITTYYGFNRTHIFVECTAPKEVPAWKAIYYELSSVLALKPVFQVIENEKADLEKKITTLKGYVVFQRLRHTVGNKTKILVFNYTGTGDVFLCCRLLDHYLRKNDISDYVLVTCNTSCKKVAELFGYENVISLSRNEGHWLRQFTYFAGEGSLNIKLMIKLPNERDISVRMDCSKLTLWDNFRYTICNLKDNIVVCHPKFNDCTYDVVKAFNKMKLPKGKTVIISPYSNSEVSGSIMFWREIVSFFSELGYTVATMVTPSERPLPRTEAIFFQYADAYSYLDYAGLFVGVRSGFCDIVMDVPVKKIVFYFENEEINDCSSLAHMNRYPIYEFASFEKMGLGREFMEIRCNYAFSENIKLDIVNYLGGNDVYKS